MFKEKGFSLLEVLIVAAILAVLSSLSTMLFVGYFQTGILDGEVRGIILNLRQAQAKAMSGEDGLRWGVHFVNPVSGSQYYQVFSTADDFSSGQIKETIYLEDRLSFSQPSEGNTLDVVFLKNTGKISADFFISLFLRADEANIKTITVNKEGRISE